MTLHPSSRLLTSILGAALIAGASWAGPKEKCPGTAESCATAMAEKLKERGWVGIHLRFLDDRLVVTSVVPESPAERAGLRADDEIVAFNGIPYDEERREDLKEAYADEMKPGHTIRYSVERGGDSIEVPVELVAIPEAVLAQWIGDHVLQAHTPAEDDERPADR